MKKTQPYSNIQIHIDEDRRKEQNLHKETEMNERSSLKQDSIRPQLMEMKIIIKDILDEKVLKR